MHIWSDNHAVRYTDANAVFTITDDDPVPTVQIADTPTVTEGGNLSFPLTLSNPTVDTVTVTVDPAAEGTSGNWDTNDYTGTAATSIVFRRCRRPRKTRFRPSTTASSKAPSRSRCS